MSQAHAAMEGARLSRERFQKDPFWRGYFTLGVPLNGAHMPVTCVWIDTSCTFFKCPQTRRVYPVQDVPGYTIQLEN
jgi:hypothetical protein